MAEKPLTSGRMRCLQALAFGRLRLSSGEKEQLLQKLVGKRGFHELTNAEADRVIDAMKGMAGQPVSRPQPRERRRARAAAAAGDVTMLLTPAQRERIAELTRELLAAGLRPAYLSGVRLRACGRPFPVTSAEGERTIEALKALHDRVAAGWRPEEPSA